MAAHHAQDALVTLGCQEVPPHAVEQFGIIVTEGASSEDPSGRIIAFQEKPRREEALSRLANTGFYLFSPRAFPLIIAIYHECLAEAQTQAKADGEPTPNAVPLDFAHDIFPRLLVATQQQPDLGPFWAQRVGGYWNDIGTPAQYLQSVRDIYTGCVAVPLPDSPDQYYRDGILYWDGAMESAQADGAMESDALLQGNIIVARAFLEAQ